MKSIFKAFLLLIALAAPVAYAADTAGVLPPAKTQFFDANGNPLTSGTVDFYIPGTTTRKATWQDINETVLNTNPVVLDAAGRATILGFGTYRQIVKDKNGNVVWDQITSSTGSGGSGGTVGDGIAVGTILPSVSPTVPTNYLLTYGQEVSRSTYSILLGKLTQSQSVICGAGSNTLSSVIDTSRINIGAAVEAACLPASTFVTAKTSNSLTVNNLAIVSTTVNATFFFFGNGNGVSTFNIPDYRDYAVMGRGNMGGASSAVVSSTYCGSDPNALNSTCGTQSKTLAILNLPPYTPLGTVVSTLGATSTAIPIRQYSTTGSSDLTKISASSNIAADAGTLSVNITGGTITSTFTGGAQGGSSTPFSILQPTRTVDFIIKVLPDINISIASCLSLSDAGTGCQSNTGTSAHTLPFLDGTNTWSGVNTFTPGQVFNGANIFNSTNTFNGAVGLVAGGTTITPTNATDIANKVYVDNFATGLRIIASSGLATAAVLPNTPTYANGALGVGATLTAGSNTTLTVDGTAAPLNTVVLVKDQASAFQNGIYSVTQAGSGAVPWILTRVTYFDQAAEMLAGTYTLVTGGATNIGRSYTLSTTVVTVGTSSVVWSQFSTIGVSSLGLLTGPVGVTQGIKTSGSNITLDSRYIGQVTAAQFGAVGDGVTDDTAALNAFATYLGGTSPYYKGILIGTSGDVFKVMSSVLLAGQSIIEGSSQNTTIRSGSATIAIIMPKDYATARSFNVSLSNVILDGAGLAATTCVDGINASGWNLENVACYDTQDGFNFRPNVQFVTAATRAATGVVTLSAPPTFVNGDTVHFENVSGMTQLNGNNYVAQGISGNTFQLFTYPAGVVPVDTTAFGTYTGDGTVNKGTIGFDAANYNTLRNTLFAGTRNGYIFDFYANSNKMYGIRTLSGINGISDAGNNNAVFGGSLENFTGTGVTLQNTSIGWYEAGLRFETTGGAAVAHRIQTSLPGNGYANIGAVTYQGTVASVGNGIIDNGTGSSWFNSYDGLKLPGSLLYAGANIKHWFAENLTLSPGTIGANATVDSPAINTNSLISCALADQVIVTPSATWPAGLMVSGISVAGAVYLRYANVTNSAITGATIGAQNFRVSCQGF